MRSTLINTLGFATSLLHVTHYSFCYKENIKSNICSGLLGSLCPPSSTVVTNNYIASKLAENHKLTRSSPVLLTYAS